MTYQDIIILFLAILSGAIGQFLLKFGALKLGKVSLYSFADYILNIISIPELFLGLTAYAMGALAYILLLSRVDLIVAGTVPASGYVIIGLYCI